MSNQKENEKIIGYGRYKHSKKQIEDFKKNIESYSFHYELSIFNKYKHPFEHDSVLDDYDSFLEFFTDFVIFENISQDEIVSFIGNHSQELRDMFYFEANKYFEDEELIYPYSSTYQLDENFHLIRKFSFHNPFNKVVISLTFLFADMICELWKKYNNETIKYYFSNLKLSCYEQPINYEEIDTISKEDFLWEHIDNQQ